MGNNFVFNDSGLKQKVKKAMPIIGIVTLVFVMLSILILPSRFKAMEICEDLGLGGESTILTGSCTKNFNEIIFIVGDTKNSPKPELNFPEYIDTALNISKAEVSAISVSNPRRNPKVIASYEDRNAREIKEKVSQFLSETSATKDGADYFGAIQTAVESADDKNKTLIYVIGSGLSDSGILNFANDNGNKNGGLLENEQKTAEDIAGKIPEYMGEERIFKGITIVWDGYGQTVVPQKDLNGKSVNKLKEIYQTVFEELGASKSNIRFKNKLNSQDSVSTKFTVKTAEPADEIIINTDYLEEFQFEGNTNKLRDSVTSRDEAKKIAAIYKSHKSAIIIATVYMSRGDCSRTEPDNELLDGRLEAIRSLLVSEGVDTDHINLVRGGFGDAPECNNGEYNEAEGAKNRRVNVKIKE